MRAVSQADGERRELYITETYSFVSIRRGLRRR